jgi:hypothetical protein
VAKDKNNISITDNNIKLINKDILVINIILIKKKAALNSTILIN